jgi:hypothetical protein
MPSVALHGRKKPWLHALCGSSTSSVYFYTCSAVFAYRSRSECRVNRIEFMLPAQSLSAAATFN